MGGTHQGGGETERKRARLWRRAGFLLQICCEKGWFAQLELFSSPRVGVGPRWVSSPGSEAGAEVLKLDLLARGPEMVL